MSAMEDPWVSDTAAAATAPAAPAAFVLLPRLHWLWRLQLCNLLLWLSTLWTHAMVLPRPPGRHRLLAAVPAVVALIMAPLLFDPFSEPLLSMTSTFMSVRMPLTKLLAACYARGPLMALPPPRPQRRKRPDTTAAMPEAAAWSGKMPFAWLRRFGGGAGSRRSVAGERDDDGSGGDGTSSDGYGACSGGSGDAHHVCVPELPLVTFFMLCPVVPRGRDERGRGGGGGRAATEAKGGAGAPGTTPQEQESAPWSGSKAERGKSDAAAGGGGADFSSSPCSLLPRTHSARKSAYGARGARLLLLLQQLAGKWLAFAVASAFAVRYGNTIPLALHAALAYGMLAIMGGLMDCTALYCTAWWGLDLVPPFRDPFRATSLADFWGRRWNVTQSRVLKGLLYDPIVEGRLVPEAAEAAADTAGGEDKGPATAGGVDGDGDVILLENDPRVAAFGHGDVDRRPHLRRRRLFSSSAQVQRPESISTAATTAATINTSAPRALGGGCHGSGSDSDTGGVDGGTAAFLAPQGAISERTASDVDIPEAPATPVTPAAAADGGGGTQATAVMQSSAASPCPAASRCMAPAAQIAAAAAAAFTAALAAAALRAAASLRSPRARRAVALLVVFVFSGIEHEIFHWYVQRFVTGRWFVFFFAHGLLLLAEAELRGVARAAAAAAAASVAAGGSFAAARACRRTALRLATTAGRLPVWACRLLTVAVLEVTASWWFFGALLEPGIVGRTLAAVRGAAAPLVGS